MTAVPRRVAPSCAVPLVLALGLVGLPVSIAAAQATAPDASPTPGAERDVRSSADSATVLRAAATRYRVQATRVTEAARREAEQRSAQFLDQQTASASVLGPVAAANTYSTQNANLHRGGQLRAPLAGVPREAQRLRTLADSLDAAAARMSAVGHGRDGGA